MKKITTIFTILMSILIISCGQKTQETPANTDNAADHSQHSTANAHAGHTSESEIMNLMHAPMMEQAFQKTANIDADFLVNMIPHHEGAILSSRKLLETTTNEQLITLANNIISAQEQEVMEFSQLITELNAQNISYEDIDTQAVGNEMEALMNTMMEKMAAVEITGNNDIDFIRGMIEHHQGAVDVSKKILEYTKNMKIKEIANRIITAQEKEIKDMNDMLNSIA